jgi:hypothetical protein
MHLPLLLALSLALPALAAPMPTPTPKETPTPVSHTGIFTLPADHKPFRPLIDGPPVDQLMEVPAPEPTNHCMKVPAVTFCDLTLGIFCTNYGRKPGECVEAPDRKGLPSIEGRDVVLSKRDVVPSRRDMVPSKRDVVPPRPQRTGSNLIDWDDGTLGPKELPSMVKRDVVPPPPQRTGSNLIDWDDGTLGPKVLPSMKLVKHDVVPSKRDVVPPPPQRTGSNLINWDNGASGPKELPSMKLVKRPFLLPSERPSPEPKVELDDRTREEQYAPVKGDGISRMPVADSPVKCSASLPPPDWETDEEHKGRNPAKLGAIGMKPVVDSPDSPVKRSALLPPPYRKNESADQEHKVWNPAKLGAGGLKPAEPDCEIGLNARKHVEGNPPVKANGMSYMPVEKRENEKSWWSRNVGFWFDEDW